jgi:putative transcriptional regulator
VPADLTPGRGLLLVATPDLDDPNFDGTVVLLLEHDPEGTIGVVLNRPSELEVDEAMSGPPGDDVDAWDDLADPPSVIFVGGPVRPNAILALAVVPDVLDPDLWEPVVGDLGVVRLGERPVPDVGDLAALRVFAGYAGWGPGQLDGEIDQGAWFVVPSDPDDCFTARPDLLWRRVLRRQGGVFTTVTDSPVLN